MCVWGGGGVRSNTSDVHTPLQPAAEGVHYDTALSRYVEFTMTQPFLGMWSSL